jgi:hypothetical protein
MSDIGLIFNGTKDNHYTLFFTGHSSVISSAPLSITRFRPVRLLISAEIPDVYTAFAG